MPFSKPELRWLALLLAGDAVFLALHFVMHTMGASTNPAFSLYTEGGYAERYEYVKQFAAAAVFATFAFRRRSLVCTSCSLLFFYLGLDNSLAIHEWLGESLAGALGLGAIGALRPRDVGECIAIPTVASAILTPLVAAAWNAGPGERAFVRGLLARLFCYGMCAVVFDALGQVSPGAAGQVFSILDDGGELGCLSLLAAYVTRAADIVQGEALKSRAAAVR